jgi:hypothetical protein
MVTSYTPFETRFTPAFGNSSIRVHGVGTVELDLKLHRTKRSGKPNSRVMTLHDVLDAPGGICNIFAIASSSDYTYDPDYKQNAGLILDSNGRRAGLISIPRLLQPFQFKALVE